MARIEVIAERVLKNPDVDYATLGIPAKDDVKIWRRRTICTEEIYAYEELGKNTTFIEMYGETFKIKEPYDEFDLRLFIVENVDEEDLVDEEEEEVVDSKTSEKA